MEIKDPMYKPDDYVVNGQGDKGQVVRVRDYNFDDNEYTYIVKLDEEFIGEEPFIIEFEYNLEPCQEPPKTVWDLKKGDNYYIVDIDGGVIQEIWWDDYDEKSYRNSGNVFLTEEEAEFEVERRKVETEMLRLGGRRHLKLHKENYCFCFDSQFSSISCECFSCLGICSSIYFDSEKEALKALNTIGKDKIKKYIFGVEE